MKHQKLISFCLLFWVIFFSSCTKEDENNPTPFLMSKEWKRGMTDKNPSTNPSGRILYYAVQNCEKDDTFKFDLNKELKINLGSNKCETNELATKTVSYSYNESNKQLVIEGYGYTVAEESKSQIKYYAPLASSIGYDYIVFLLE